MQFVVFSRSATAMSVLLYDKVSDREPVDIIHSTATRTAGATSERVRSRRRRRQLYLQVDARPCLNGIASIPRPA